ncbi:MAG: DNA repair protein RadC [Eubacteriales bacterium]|nr:DNA repair protein RadC [Eubacteriales bacterium]
MNRNQYVCDMAQHKSLRPYEKCSQYGARALTDAELLAVILRTGTRGCSAIELSEQVLRSADGNGALNSLADIEYNDLMKLKGIGNVKALQIQCISELSRRIAKQTAYERLDFSNPEAIARYYMEDMRYLDKEHLILSMLDNKCRLIKDTVISIGTVNASLVTPRELFIEALKSQAVSIVILHNHPSGDSSPSRQDIEVTLKIKKAGELIGIYLVDHIIIGDNTYTSLKQERYL